MEVINQWISGSPPTFPLQSWTEKLGGKNFKISMEIELQSAEINLKCIPLRLKSFVACLSRLKHLLNF